MNAILPAGKADARRLSAAAAWRVPPAAGLPELRELRSFAVAARTGNLGRAARHLNVTAAAVSQQLGRLEKTLAVELLIRHSRGVSTTPAGRELLQRVDTILGLLETPLGAETEAATIPGAVRAALPAELGPLLAAPLLVAMQRQGSHATFSLAESGDDPLAALCAGAFDIALLQDPPKRDDLEIARLVTEDLGIVVAPDHVLAQSALPLRLRELVATPLILPNPRHWIRRLLAKAEAQRGIRFAAAAQADSVPMVLALVRRGVGAAILPAAAVADNAACGALVFRALMQPALPVAHAIAVRHAAPPETHHLAGAMADAVRTVAASGAWPGARLVRPAAQLAPPPRLLPAVWRTAALARLAASPAGAEGD